MILSKKDFDIIKFALENANNYCDVNWDCGNDSTCVNIELYLPVKNTTYNAVEFNNAISNLIDEMINEYDLPNATGGYHVSGDGTINLVNGEMFFNILYNEYDPESGPVVEDYPTPDELIKNYDVDKELFDSICNDVKKYFINSDIRRITMSQRGYEEDVESAEIDIRYDDNRLPRPNNQPLIDFEFQDAYDILLEPNNMREILSNKLAPNYKDYDEGYNINYFSTQIVFERGAGNNILTSISLYADFAITYSKNESVQIEFNNDGDN